MCLEKVGEEGVREVVIGIGGGFEIIQDCLGWVVNCSECVFVDQNDLEERGEMGVQCWSWERLVFQRYFFILIGGKRI